MLHLPGNPKSYRIALGPQQSRKAIVIRTIRPLDRPDAWLERVAKSNVFSLHARVSCERHSENKGERLCRYIARSAVAIPRLPLLSTDKVAYTLKSPYLDGINQEAFEGTAIRTDIEVCGRCVESVKVIARIEYQSVIDRNLTRNHLAGKPPNNARHTVLRAFIKK